VGFFLFLWVDGEISCGIKNKGGLFFVKHPKVMFTILALVLRRYLLEITKWGKKEDLATPQPWGFAAKTGAESMGATTTRPLILVLALGVAVVATDVEVGGRRALRRDGINHRCNEDERQP